MNTELLDSMGFAVPTQTIALLEFSESEALFHKPAAVRMAAGLRLFVEFLNESGLPCERIDRAFMDRVVAWIDGKISLYIDQVLHHPDFQALESTWCGLHHLVGNIGHGSNTRVELLDCSAEEMQADFEESPGILQSGIYRLVYTDEYDTPGGEPYTAMLADWMLDSSPDHIELLRNISHVASAAHCPFLGGVGAGFFGKTSMDELPRIDDLDCYLERAEFLQWRSFRDTEDSRYTGLVMPRFLLRKPWDTANDRYSPFVYRENANLESGSFLWGNAIYPFAVNMVHSFVRNGWCVQIRGPESGGKVEQLPMHCFDAGRGLETLMPVEILIPETREFEFSRQGFIPLSYYKNRDYACFFSANSAQKPREYLQQESTANARVNARLPYIFLTSRIAHYLKVLQRENIGAAKDAAVLQQELDSWLRSLVTEMKNPGPELVASHPLSRAAVNVEPNPENPGFFRVSLTIVPHFQVEGFDVNLSLVGQMPAVRST